MITIYQSPCYNFSLLSLFYTHIHVLIWGHRVWGGFTWNQLLTPVSRNIKIVQIVGYEGSPRCQLEYLTNVAKIMFLTYLYKWIWYAVIKVKGNSFCHRPWRETLIMRDDAILCYLDPSIFQLLFPWLDHRGIAYLCLSQPMAGISSHSHSHEVKSNVDNPHVRQMHVFGLQEAARQPTQTQGNMQTPHRSAHGDSNLEATSPTVAPPYKQEFNITLYSDFKIKVKAKTGDAPLGHLIARRFQPPASVFLC